MTKYPLRQNHKCHRVHLFWAETEVKIHIYWKHFPNIDVLDFLNYFTDISQFQSGRTYSKLSNLDRYISNNYISTSNILNFSKTLEVLFQYHTPWYDCYIPRGMMNFKTIINVASWHICCTEFITCDNTSPKWTRGLIT